MQSTRAKKAAENIVVSAFCLDATTAREIVNEFYQTAEAIHITFYKNLDELRNQARLYLPDRILIRLQDCEDPARLELVFSWPREVQKRVVFAVSPDYVETNVFYRGVGFPVVRPGSMLQV